ncbi:MAG: hypothetical protein DHS20C05_06620 [Hyphococcus sp.]|nr:MAG: hypothetical protein DHS20C05_06620 [Marinicaulis sp.]
MSFHSKSLIIVFIISALVIFFFRKPFAKQYGAKRVDNWRNLWLSFLVCAYFIDNYWLFVVLTMSIVFFFARSEPQKPAIFALMFASIPTLGASIPGFAGINRFIEVNPQLAIAAVVLIPMMLVRKHMTKIARVGNSTDTIFLLFLILTLSLSIRAPSFTHMLRIIIQDFLTLAPLYYVFSRFPKSFEDIRIISAAFILPALVLSVITILEMVLNQHYYTTISSNWFGSLPFSFSYRSGFLRGYASALNPITWGFIAMCAIGVGFATLNDHVSKLHRLAAFTVLTGGLIACLSRGPWVGAIAVFMVYLLISPNAGKRITQAVVTGGIVVLLSLLTPFGNTVIDLMPVVGTQESGTIDYRQDLLSAAWVVMLENPLFGSSDFLEHSGLESMRQGQGIIDIVNTYLQVGLKSGLVGVSLFTMLFLSTLLSLRGAMKSAIQYNPMLAQYCRAYFATLVGVMLTIFTTSSVGQIPILYWMLIAIGVALSRVERVEREKFYAETTTATHQVV